MIRFLLSAIDVNPNDVDIPKSPLTTGTNGSIERTLQLVWIGIGSVAVLMIVIGGLQYVLTRGDPQKAAKAKNTILYALVGLVISITAWSIVTFVIGRI